MSEAEETFSSSDAETVCPEERRRTFDQIVQTKALELDPRLLETIGPGALEESCEGFVGERAYLALWIATYKESMNLEMQIIARCTEALLLGGGDGTAASRLALGRAVGAFLLNDCASQSVIADRIDVREGHVAGPATEGNAINFAEAAGRIRARRRSQRGKPL
jgi:hypothetical protein